MSIYFDNAASTKVKSEVLKKFNEVTEKIYGNPSSEHTAGQAARKVIWEAEDILSEKLGCKSDEIFFTTGATMSNSLIIQGFLKKHPNGMIITTNIEHNDILLLVNDLLCYRHILRVNNDGIINLEQLSKVLEYGANEMGVPVLVSIQMANSETGVIQPIQHIASICKDYNNVFLHMDATQYLPYYPINVECWGIDALSMSGQKIGGIKGSGLLVVRQILQDHISPIIYGEQGLIGGTPSTSLIASLGKAFELLDYDTKQLKHKRDYMLDKVRELGGVLIGTKTNRLPNNIYCRFPGINGLVLLHLLSDQGICIGTGSACSTDSDKPSHVAQSYGLTDAEAFECVRFTLSNENTYEDIDYTVNVLKSILELLK